MRILCIVAAAALLCPVAAAASAEKESAGYVKPAPVKFVRLFDSEAGKPGKLQVAIARYKPQDGSDLVVTLIGVVHVGDAEFYQRLTKEFDRHQVVLYELVAPKGEVPDTDEPSPIAKLLGYANMARQLGLSEQLAEIDYRRSNFLHADLSLEELLARGRAKGEDQFTLALTACADLLQTVNRLENGGPTLFDALADPELAGNPKKLKAALAKQLAGENPILEGFTVLTEYLISERNQAVMKVLDEQIAAGKKRIAVFYGAGHNADFHRRLLVDYGMKLDEVTWVTAWDLSKHLPKVRPGESPLEDLLRQMMEPPRRRNTDRSRRLKQ